MIKPKKSNCDKTQQLKGEQDTAELGANTDAKPTCTNFSFTFFLQIFIFLMLTKEYVFVLSALLTKFLCLPDRLICLSRIDQAERLA